MKIYQLCQGRMSINYDFCIRLRAWAILILITLFGISAKGQGLFIDSLNDNIVGSVYSPIGGATLIERNGHLLVVPAGSGSGVLITSPFPHPASRLSGTTSGEWKYSINLTPFFSTPDSGKMIMTTLADGGKTLFVKTYDNVKDSIIQSEGDKYGGVETECRARFIPNIEIREEQKAKCSWWPPGWKGSGGCCYIIYYYIPFDFVTESPNRTFNVTKTFAPYDPTINDPYFEGLRIISSDSFYISKLEIRTGTDVGPIQVVQGNWSISPGFLRTMGGDTVRVSGLGFDTLTSYKLTLGGSIISNPSIINDSTIIFVAPPHSKGLTHLTFESGNLIAPAGELRYFASPQPLLLGDDTLRSAHKNRPYIEEIKASGGNGPRSYQLASGNLPSGISLTSNGFLSGTATEMGVFSFFVSVSDSSGENDVSMYILEVTQSAQPEILFTGIGKLTGNPLGSIVGGISGDGFIVVGGSGETGDQAFLWTYDGGMLGLGDFPGGSSTSWAEGASYNGSSVIGTSEYDSGKIQAYRWSAENGMVGLGFLPGGLSSSASAISDSGNVIVGVSDYASGQQAFKWTNAGGMVGLGFLPGGSTYSEGLALSADGSVVVGQSQTSLGFEGFRWTEGTGMVNIGSLSETKIVLPCATVLNGTVITGGAVSDSSNPNYEAFVWTQDHGMMGLGDLPGGSYSSIAYSLSGDGSMAVGHSSTGVGQEEAFIWDVGKGMRNLRSVLVSDYGLDLSGWTLTNAAAISRGGKIIVGNGTNPHGDSEGWAAYIQTTTISVRDGWNMLSTPGYLSNNARESVFPTAVSNAYSFAGAYIPHTLLEFGTGYWLKFNGAQNLVQYGISRHSDTIGVVAHWNMIGSISDPVSVGSVESNPLGNITSAYFGYENGGYVLANTITPGHAYWVKASGSGKLVLSSNGLTKGVEAHQDLLDRFNELTIVDKQGIKQRLYFGVKPNEKFDMDRLDMPPSGPDDLFEARFISNRLVEVYSRDRVGPVEYKINFKSGVYPFTIQLATKPANARKVTILVTAGDNVLGAWTVQNDGSLQITDPKITGLRLQIPTEREIPTEFALRQNYPNPFNPSTIIGFDLPDAAKVTLRVYDLLGQEVGVLVDDQTYEAGSYELTFNAENLASGLYFYRLQAGKYTDSRKMMLVK